MVNANTSLSPTGRLVLSGPEMASATPRSPMVQQVLASLRASRPAPAMDLSPLERRIAAALQRDLAELRNVYGAPKRRSQAQADADNQVLRKGFQSKAR